MKRRFLAWLMCAVMLFNNALPVFATETTEHVHSEECSEDCTLGTPVTTDTGDEDDTTDPEIQTQIGNKEHCPVCHHQLDKCKCEKEESTTPNICPDCKQVECTCECDCGLKKGHDGECQPYCTCGTDPHTEDCKLYVAPEKPSCLEGCTDDSHAEGCPNAPTVETTTCSNCSVTYNVGAEHSCNCTICAEPWTEEHTCPPCSICGAAFEKEHTCPTCEFCDEIKIKDVEHTCPTCVDCLNPKLNGHECPKCKDCDSIIVKDAEHICPPCKECNAPFEKEHECAKCSKCKEIIKFETKHECKCECTTEVHDASNDFCPLFVGQKWCSCEYTKDENGNRKHAEGCVKLAECAVCEAKGIHFTDNCPFANPVSAEVYTLIDGIHVPVSDDVIDVSRNNNKTYYIQTSDSAQNIKVSHPTLIGIIGVSFDVNNDEYALVSEDGGALWGDGKAHITIAANTPANTEIVISAFKSKVTIHVVDELITKKPENNINTTIEGTNTTINIGGNVPTDVTIAASVVESYHEDVLEYVENPEEILFAYDITPVDADGNPWQPQDGEAVNVTLDVAAEDGTYIGILHEHDGVLENIGTYIVVDRQVSFTVNNFSNFYGYVTDFEYNGHVLQIYEGKSMTLSNILLSLGIDKKVTDVSSVTASNNIIKITAPSGTTTDWTIAIIADYKTKEDFKRNLELTITFKDSTTLKIPIWVSDVYYYVDSFPVDLISETATDTLSYDNITYTVNKTPIPTSGVPRMEIYARPGMAIRFDTATWSEFGSWEGNCGSKAALSSDGLWSWVYGASTGNGTPYNYYIIDSNISTYKESTIYLYTGNCKTDTSLKPCGVVTLHIMPDVEPTLLEDTLANDDRYSVSSIPVTLYNYDGKKFNDYYNENGQKWLAFSGVSMGNSATTDITLPWTGSNRPNSGSISTGIMNNILGSNYLPEMKSILNTDMFSTDTLEGAKEVFENVGFQFIYDNETGYYTYSSNLNHAQFYQSENVIKLYNETLAPYFDDNAQNSKAGFYPFADINEAVVNKNPYNDDYFSQNGEIRDGYTHWEEALYDSFFQQDALYAKDLVTTGSTTTASTVDMHFGLQMVAPFYMPADMHASNGSNLVYEFSGDDDLWVFVDNQLVLDLGGAHTAVHGTIDFTDGKVTVSSHGQMVYNLEDDSYTLSTENDSAGNKPTGAAEWTFEELGISEIKADQMHTLRVFYLERWSGESNCRMHFNLPLVPENGIKISKNLKNQSNDNLSVTPNTEYIFNVYVSEDTDKNGVADSEYTLVKNKKGSGGLDIDADGNLVLKANQTAFIGGFNRFSEVYVVEQKPNDGYKYLDKVTIDGQDGVFSNNIIESEKKIIILGEEGEEDYITFDFTNYMKTQPLTINKFVNGGEAALVNPEQEFEFTLDFTKSILETGEGAISATKSSEAIALTDGGTFTLQQGQHIEIPRVPVNMTYTLSESDPDANPDDGITFDKPTFAPTTSTCINEGNVVVNEFDTVNNFIVNDDAENVITVTNKQRFTITITKNTDVAAPDQSFIFKIQGTDEHNSNITNEVVIPYSAFNGGNTATVTIAGLPVGRYEITEDTNWSWRFELNTNAADNDFDVANNDTDAIFNNTREHIYWMDGEAWCKNVFTGSVGQNNPLGDYILTKKEQDPVTGN